MHNKMNPLLLLIPIIFVLLVVPIVADGYMRPIAEISLDKYSYSKDEPIIVTITIDGWQSYPNAPVTITQNWYQTDYTPYSYTIPIPKHGDNLKWTLPHDDLSMYLNKQYILKLYYNGYNYDSAMFTR